MVLRILISKLQKVRGQMLNPSQTRFWQGLYQTELTKKFPLFPLIGFSWGPSWQTPARSAVPGLLQRYFENTISNLQGFIGNFLDGGQKGWDAESLDCSVFAGVSKDYHPSSHRNLSKDFLQLT